MTRWARCIALTILQACALASCHMGDLTIAGRNQEQPKGVSQSPEEGLAAWRAMPRTTQKAIITTLGVVPVGRGFSTVDQALQCWNATPPDIQQEFLARLGFVGVDHTKE